ncbi:glycosyltransferase family 4 protein [Agromyces neolithicus]|uniref:D-inositol 3-phosphate glycosyltransferase n=1 Tax=Agromyces neolithicus TaxID=269420 RepID=A0ABN2LWH9_9MICO
MIDILHAITPGDHFSPRTGSAIPTVVDGLAAAATRDGAVFRHAVVLDRSTMRPRYDSAAVIEYAGARGPTRRDRAMDLARGRVGLPRTAVARYYEPVADAIRTREPSFVLAHNAPVLPWLLRDTEHRVVLYAHNDLLRTYTRQEAGRVLDSVAAIVCVSDSLAERTRAVLPGRLAERVRVVRNGIDCERFTPATTDEGAASSTRDAQLRVVFVGRMVAEKGPDVLIRAVEHLGRPDLEYLLVGSQGFARDAPLSPYEHELRELADEATAASGAVISFEPFVDRAALPALLRSADLLVAPSRWAEPSGLTAAEGLASGLPVIASRVGGLPDVVGAAGVLVDPDDPAALAEAIASLADNPEARQRMSERARAHAVAHDWSWAWSNLRQVLEEL